MKKVNLDKEFEKWKKLNESKLINEFLGINDFYGYLNEKWVEYQAENDLVDESNEFDEFEYSDLENDYKKEMEEKNGK